MEIYGSKSTFNLEAVFLQNIQNSEYYNKRLKGQFSFDNSLNEIYTAVNHVEPWMSGS
jgi:hypothetical protein